MIRIEIQTDNEAFANHLGAEVARILREFSNFIELACNDPGFIKRTLRDSNGNTVGTVEVS
jgi:hypothetical protein